MLTDMQLKKAKPGEKDYKLPDTGGLYVLVSTTGNRSWRLKYRFGKKEKLHDRHLSADIPQAARDAGMKRRVSRRARPGRRKKTSGGCA